MADFFTNQSMNQLSIDIRNRLRDEASVFDGDFEKIQYICQQFLKNYDFDYSVLRSPNEINARKPDVRPFEYQGRTYFNSSEGYAFPDEKHRVKLSPSVHALKMGTCATFTSELEWFAKEFGIAYERKNEGKFCYDAFDGVAKEDEVRKMLHHWIEMELDGNIYKIDVAGALMAMDYNKRYPEAKIDPKSFMFTDKNAPNPFQAIAQTRKEKGDE